MTSGFVAILGSSDAFAFSTASKARLILDFASFICVYKLNVYNYYLLI